MEKSKVGANGKITGNFAADVLAELERNNPDRERAKEMRKLDKDISSYLAFDVGSMSSQMNNAFEGKKELPSDLMKTKPAESARDRRVKAIMHEAAGNLDPILEESKNAMVPYKPNADLAEQRKMKNQELKNKVKMIVAQEKMETGSVMSSDSTAGPFITQTKSAKK